jgi:hypothetical protein
MMDPSIWDDEVNALDLATRQLQLVSRLKGPFMINCLQVVLLSSYLSQVLPAIHSLFLLSFFFSGSRK